MVRLLPALFKDLTFVLFIERDHALRNITEASELKEQQQQVKDMRKELKDKNVLLRLAIKGDAQRIKNILQHDKHMRRSLPKWDSYVRNPEYNTITYETLYISDHS